MINLIVKFYNKYKVIFNNFIFVGLVQFFSLLAPLITYPYLVETLGMELYGVVLTAQILVSYATLLIDFGSNSVCAKNISLYRDDEKKLSEIVSSVLTTRLLLFFVCFIIYVLVVINISAYYKYVNLFLLSYLLIMNELLFPQFFFQGIEKLKVVALLSILVKLVFILLIFLFVKQQTDYLYVPVLYAIGYTIAGIFALIIMYKKYNIKFYFPNLKIQYQYFKECFPILATDMICTIKDKFNYSLVGTFIGMGEVVIYDLGLKLSSLIARPSIIITTVLLPRFAKNRSVHKMKIIIASVFCMSFLLVLLLNLFLPFVAEFFLHRQIDLLPLRLFSLAPLFLCPSIVISNNFFVGFGYNRYIFYSILVTTMVYVVLLLLFWINNYLYSLYSFIFLSVITYFSELLYRLYVFRKLSNK